jgi:hypothetical protein
MRRIHKEKPRLLNFSLIGDCRSSPISLVHYHKFSMYLGAATGFSFAVEHKLNCYWRAQVGMGPLYLGPNMV